MYNKGSEQGTPNTKHQHTVEKKRIDCRKCKDFEVTWDKGLPYGCKAMGASKQPSSLLGGLSASGIACLRFEQRPKPAK